MKTKFGVVIIAVCFTCLWASMTLGQSSVLYSQFSDGQSTFGPSQLWSAAGVNSEVADDFSVIGNIDRVYAEGFIWGTVDFQGAYIRFYEYTPSGTPGVLQREYFLGPSDPNVQFNQIGGAIDATLSPPFAATGKHFLSVQPVINYWYWWSSQTNSPRGQAFYFRNNATAEAWHHGDNLNMTTNADVSFWLYGATTGAGTISNLSATTLERSGYLEIFGSNLGDSGQVLIGGISASVADWTSNRIVAYVPETAPLTNVSVQVINGSGIPSNVANLNIVTRQSNGRVNWRFRMNGPYSEVRPAIASDGTIYSIDVFNHLYALQPNGALKWLVRGAGDKGLTLGPDGTIYVASEPFIKAFNPDGTTKWTFTQNPRSMICLGVGVGPDGNIYSVGTEGPGVFSLTSQGTLRWTNPEGYARPIVDYGEIAFGPNGSNPQMYFYANNHLRALTLGGSPIFTITDSSPAHLRQGQQPVVAPDGSVHTMLNSYSPGGVLLWSFPTPYPLNVFTPADIGSNGVHYFVQNLVEMFALNPDGSLKWHRTATSNLQGPIVDPSNSLLVVGGSNTGIETGFIVGASTFDGRELWRVNLPIEDPTVFNPSLGIFGFNQFVDTRARFSPDGSTAYLITATATGDNNTSKSFVYSLNAGGSAPAPTPTPTPVPTATPTPTPSATPAPTAAASLRSTSITLAAKVARSGVTVTGAVTVRNGNGGIVSGAIVDTTWTLPGGTTQSQSAMTNSKGVANFIVRNTRGTYTLTATNISKSGFIFDSANSVLTRSITK
jgi:IPT/TIG domain